METCPNSATCSFVSHHCVQVPDCAGTASDITPEQQEVAKKPYIINMECASSLDCVCEAVQEIYKRLFDLSIVSSCL